MDHKTIIMLNHENLQPQFIILFVPAKMCLKSTMVNVHNSLTLVSYRTSWRLRFRLRLSLYLDDGVVISIVCDKRSALFQGLNRGERLKTCQESACLVFALAVVMGRPVTSRFLKKAYVTL